MPSEYAMERTHGQKKVIIHAADLYILEQWNDESTLSDEDQRSEIFTKWLDIGWKGRMPYVEQLEQMSRDDDDITDTEKDQLARVRNPSDRQGISYTRLVRTFYSDDSDTKLADILSQSEFDEPVFNDAALYDAGADDGLLSLHNILTRIPQIVEQTADFALYHGEQTQETLQEALKVGLDELEYAVAIYHQAVKWTHVLIYDKEAYDTSNVLLVYLDDRGRVLRYSRLWDSEGLQAASGLLWTGQDDQQAMWEEGEFGEDWEPRHLARQMEAQNP